MLALVCSFFFPLVLCFSFLFFLFVVGVFFSFSHFFLFLLSCSFFVTWKETGNSECFFIVFLSFFRSDVAIMGFE